VEIEVETTDRAGGFIGVLYVSGNNLGKGLLEEGLGWVQGGSGGQEYDDAETRAKAARKGIWKDWDESKEAETAKSTSGSVPQARKEFLDVVVTNMNDDGTFAVQVVNDSVHQLDRLMKEFRAFHDAGSPLAQNVRLGDLVAAKFSGDNEFYRAKVKKVDRAAQKADVVCSLTTGLITGIHRLRQPGISQVIIDSLAWTTFLQRSTRPSERCHSIFPHPAIS
jgi:staphylococcal nuclease domain-containing protein 1